MQYRIFNQNTIAHPTGEPMEVRLTDDDGVVYQIPLTLENRDCVRFLADWQAGATVKDAAGADLPYSGAAVTALGLDPA